MLNNLRSLSGLDGKYQLSNDSAFVDITKATLVRDKPSGLEKAARNEAILLLGLLFFGFVLMPIVIFFVGKSIFGAYGGQGYSDFFGTLSGKIRTGDGVAWFLVLSPYLIWQCLRLTALVWRLSGKTA